jgi:hypothetical protein
MTFVLIGTLAVLASFSYDFWRATSEREIRWALYALRDELRWQAIQDRSLLSSDLFWYLDRSLTNQCEVLEKLSVWDLVPFILSKSNDAAPAVAALDRVHEPGNELFLAIFQKSADLAKRHFCERHFLLFGLVKAARFFLPKRSGALPLRSKDVAEYAVARLAQDELVAAAALRVLQRVPCPTLDDEPVWVFQYDVRGGVLDGDDKTLRLE